MKFEQFEEWMFWDILWRFQIMEQSSFLDVLYHSALKTKMDIVRVHWEYSAATTESYVIAPVGVQFYKLLFIITLYMYNQPLNRKIRKRFGS